MILETIFLCNLNRTGGFCYVLFLLFFQLALTTTAQQQSFYFPPLSSEEFPYIWFVDDKDSIRLTDELFYDHSTKVVFHVNKYGLPLNSPVLKELETIVLPRANKNSAQLVGILIRGAASPEGPYLNNKMLSERRAQALIDFVTSRIAFNGLHDSLFTFSHAYDIEDYGSLCIAMQRAGDADYALVKELCDTWQEKDVFRLKEELKRVRQGQLWSRLLRDYFPQLRAARMMLFFRRLRSDRIEPARLPVPETALLLPALSPITLTTGRLLRQKLLAVKTNLLFYGAYIPGYDRWAPIPNVALEYYPRKGHLTYGASFDMPWWQDYDAHKYFQLRNYQVEARYYLRGASKSTLAREYNKKAFTGFYLQGYAHLGVFGICFDADRGWVGEGAGGGVGAGYVMPLSKNGHWRLELGAQVGFFRCKYDPYQYENPVNPAMHDGLYYYKWSQKPELFKKRQYRWNWVGPTRVGITLSYDLLYRRIQKRGISLKSKETCRYVVSQEERRAYE